MRSSIILLALGALALTSYAAKQKDATTFYWVAVEKNDGLAKDTWLRDCKR